MHDMSFHLPRSMVVPSGFSSELLVKMTTEPLATNAHHKGVAPEDMAKSGLDEMFRCVRLS